MSLNECHEENLSEGLGRKDAILIAAQRSSVEPALWDLNERRKGTLPLADTWDKSILGRKMSRESELRWPHAGFGEQRRAV